MTGCARTPLCRADEAEEELFDTLIAISVVSKHLANRIKGKDQTKRTKATEDETEE